jgi:DNA-binding NarL/FixJ family response regulator
MGSDGDLVFVASHLSMVYVWLGRYSVAADVAHDVVVRAENTGGGVQPVLAAKAQRAIASAYLGHERAAREDVRAAIAGARQSGAQFLTVWPMMILSFLEVSLGNHAAALKVLRPLLIRAMAAGDLGSFPASYVPDAVEAMVALGRLDDALPLIDMMERRGAEVDGSWLSALAARCRSMALAADGDLTAAEEALHRAMKHHDRLPMPFERARTQLFLGQVLRRQRRKNLAMTTLREALATFTELGTPLWADRARAELKRTDAPRTGASDLTPSELRVARLAASGMTNKDIASALFISPKTVEHNLSSVYRKLAVRTRSELARRAGELGKE